MPDLTPSQSGVIDGLIEQHGEPEGGIEFRDDGTALYTTAGDNRVWAISKRGKVTELESSAESSLAQPESPAGNSGDSRADSETTPPAVASEPSASSSTDIATVDDPAVYQALTAADERQIQAEIEGRALGSMLYSYKQGGETVTGLSWKGVQEAIRAMNTRGLGRIKVTSRPPVFEEITVKADGEQRKAVRCTVYAEDEIHGSGRWGTATQTREMKAKGEWVDDTFADAKALSKAQRNAMEGMLPLALVEELKAAYLGEGSVEYINSTAVDVTELPPALTDERAEQLGDEIRSLYEDFKRAHPEGLKAMPPAAFNRYYVAAQHSHERLEDFKAHMAQQVEEAEQAKETANA